MSLRKIINVKTLSKLIESKTPSLKVIDCTYAVGAKPDPKNFKEELYGKFDLLRERRTQQKLAFLGSHIPTATHFDLDAGLYPGKTERFSHYEPEVFERYAQLLGLNNSDHLVFYSRGPFGGMLFAARAFWLFRSYGHEKLSLLDGGLQAWENAGYPLESQEEYERVKTGDYHAKDTLNKFVMPFDEFNKDGGILDNPDRANLFDTRIRAQFDGRQDTGLDPNRVNGTRIPNTTNVPAIEFINDKGTLKSTDEIKSQFFADENTKVPTVTYCNTGMQASLVAVLQDEIFPEHPPRLYNGGLTEMSVLAPKRISDGPPHLV